MIVSVIAFGMYFWDKASAKNRTRRVPEKWLLAVGIVGGWPGALVAQELLRHKTRDRGFQIQFWTTVALHLCLLGLLIWSRL